MNTIEAEINASQSLINYNVNLSLLRLAIEIAQSGKSLDEAGIMHYYDILKKIYYEKPNVVEPSPKSSTDIDYQQDEPPVEF